MRTLIPSSYEGDRRQKANHNWESTAINAAPMRNRRSHAVIIPYPAQGHVIPLMQLSHCLVNHGGFEVTFINTEYNHKRILDSSLSSYCTSTINDDHHKEEFPIRFVSIPDGLAPEENRNDLGKLTTAITTFMPGKLEEIIRKINNEDVDQNNIDDNDQDVAVTCVVADYNMGWALEVAEKMGLRKAVFCPGAAALMIQAFAIPKLIEDGIIDDEGNPTRNQIIQLSPTMPSMNTEQFSWNCFGDPATNKILFNFIHNNTKIAQAMDWMICNSFFELEPTAFTLFPNILPIGPLLASDRLGRFSSGNFWPEDPTCLNWLDQQPPRSVIYVAFGSFTIFEQIQFQELAFGLEISGKHFLWVTRPGSSHPYPDGFQTRISTRGLIVGWAPQQNVLSHPSVGCFLSHCGWNSTLEGVSNGVSFLCWPYFADQFLDQEYICDIWKIGLKLNKNENAIVSRTEIMEKIKQVNEDEGMKTRALRLMEMARESVRDGGSSSKNFKDFVERIK